MSGHRLAPGGLALVLCVVASVAPGPGRAGDGAAPAPGDPADARRGPPVPIVADDAPEATLYEVVVRLRRPEPGGPGAAATVIDADRFAGEAKSVAELVATAPGVAVREYGGLGQLATVSVRGASADGVRVLLDGLPLNTAAGGGVNLSTIPRQWISRIEVVRGAEGARFGAGALGGAVNVVTRRAAPGEWSSQLSYGSFRTLSAGVEAGAGGARWNGVLSLGYDETGGRFPYRFDETPLAGGPAGERTRTNNAGRSGGALAKGSAELGGGRLDLVGQLSAGEHGLPGWPYALTPDDHQSERRGSAVVRYARPVTSALALRTELAGLTERLDTRVAALNGTARQRIAGGRGTAALLWTRGAHAADAGLTAGGERLAGDGFGGPHVRPEVAAFASDDVAFGPRLRIAPAARLERVGAFTGWSAKLGADAAIAGPLSLRAGAGRTFRAPSLAELHLQQGILQPNPQLAPEEGWSADAGLAADGRLGLARAVAFAALYRDLIVYEPATLQRLKPFNAGRALVRGVELEAASTPRGPLGLAGSLAYTWLASENLRGDETVLGRDLPHRPRHRLFARGAGSRGPASAHLELHVVGAQYQDRRNLVRIPQATTLGAGAAWRFARRPDVGLHVELRNLLDARDLQDGFGNPLPGRMVLFTLRATSDPRGSP